MDDFLTKPFTLHDIEEHLGRVAGVSGRKHKAITVTLETSANDETMETSSGNESDLSEVINLTAIDSIQEVEKQTGRSLLGSIFDGYTEQMICKLDGAAKG